MSNPKQHVLLVEDNPADVNLVQEALAEAHVNCTLQIMRDGLQAVQFIDQLDADASSSSPDLILLDLNLPKVSGEEVLKRIRLSPRCGTAKVLIISSSDARSDRERVLNLGASEYFRKPSGLNEFMMLGPKVRSMLEGVPS
jgi:chemotaxis family two-component system response regulator Rcp1